jgi:hypothetical protein
MTSPDKSRHVEVKEGDQTVAAAEVATLDDAEGRSGHRCCPHPGWRRRVAGLAWSMR